MSPSLGLIMIVRDEAENLPLSLGPLAGRFDEVVVVDTGSQDQTPALAAGFGARVKDFSWGGDFSAARNASIRAARADCLFWLDADNAISPAAVERLRQVIDATPAPIIGWAVEVLVPSNRRLIQKRLFPRRPDVFFSGRVHEQLVHPAGFGFSFTGVEIRHWGYRDPESARAKARRNLDLLQAELAQRPGDFYLLYQAGKTLYYLGRIEEAEALLGRAAAAGGKLPENPELLAHALVLWAATAERAGRLEEALARLEKAPDLPGAKGLIHFHQGRISHRLQRHSTAAAHLKTALALGFDLLTLELSPQKLAATAADLLGRAQAALDGPTGPD